MNKKYVLSAFLALIATFVGAQERKPVPMPTVSTDTLVKHVMELSSETYGGRMAGSEGYGLALEYVAGVLKSYGVQDMEMQEFAVECNEVENCKFNVYRPGMKEKRVFTLGNEFCCAGMTGRGYVDAQMVFCGYGVDAGGYNDYKRVDVQGKVAVVLTGLPDGHGLPRKVAEQCTSLRDKARTAERHGAIGMLAVNVSRSCLPTEPQGRLYCGELPHLTTFPILQLTLECGRELLHDEQMELDSAIAAIGALKSVQSFSLTKKAEVDVNARYRPAAPTYNICGLLEGTDKQLRKEYIVVGASLDGIGMQGETCLFPGADINASGVAAVLETARVLSNPQYRPKRSVLFVLFSGGEHQFLGSRTFAATYARQSRIEAFVCAQNIGYGDSLLVLGGSKYTTLYEIAADRDTLAGRHNIKQDVELSLPRGDARALDAIGVPSLVFTTWNGMHENHTTTDIWENVDRRVMTMATQLMAETVAQLGEGLYMGRSPKSKIIRN